MFHSIAYDVPDTVNTLHNQCPLWLEILIFLTYLFTSSCIFVFLKGLNELDFLKICRQQHIRMYQSEPCLMNRYVLDIPINMLRTSHDWLQCWETIWYSPEIAWYVEKDFMEQYHHGYVHKVSSSAVPLSLINGLHRPVACLGVIYKVYIKLMYTAHGLFGQLLFFVTSTMDIDGLCKTMVTLVH